MANADVRKELDCSICLNIYTDPVTLRCGHNFCRMCIDRVLDSQKGTAHYACPECRKRFRSRPTLQKNITLCNIVESFRSSQPERKETGISCTYCIHTSVPAVKSCLLCEASLCDSHLNVHSNSPEHVLSDPTASLENRKCPVHKKVLVYYCTEDATSICVSCCLIGEHKGHQIESLEEAAEKIKKQLQSDIQKLGTKREKTEKRVQSLQERKRKVQGKASEETERVAALFRDLKRQLEELEMRVRGEISGQAEQVSRSVSDSIQQLEAKKYDLSSKMRQMEELCNSMDPLIVLQESAQGGLCDGEDGDDDTERQNKFLLTAGDLDVALISHTLHTGLSDIISGINGASYVQEIADILLDVNTAGYYLHISDDRKTVSWSDISQNRPETPERFQYAPQVLSSRSFSSGRHYWDAEVSGSDEWRVGMCYPSIERKGIKSQSAIGSNNKSWCLHRTEDRYLMIHDGNKIQLADNNCIERVRIYLDYEAGQISFYDLCDPIRHLHTFTATFTEPLLVALRVWEGCVRISGGKQEM
ncbi:E3 ubiquitin/ISG15 ligase TRIM25-like [Lithobates pipiens]